MQRHMHIPVPVSTYLSLCLLLSGTTSIAYIILKYQHPVCLTTQRDVIHLGTAEVITSGNLGI